MEEKQLTKDYLYDRLQTEIHNAHNTFTSCTMSTIRWLQRYSHCYSIACSFFCIPLWILILPIALVLDIFIFIVVLIIFIIVFIVYFLSAPCMLSYQFSSCSDGWNPLNMYRYSLTQALMWAQMIYACFDVIWSCYCGSGEIEYGAPMFCSYCCGEGCHRMCTEATDIKISNQVCTIL